MDLNGLRNSVTLRFGAVGFLILFLVIASLLLKLYPLFRESQARSAELDVAESWGSRQQIAGPTIQIDFLEPPVSGSASKSTNALYLMPTKLEVDISSIHEIRKRGVFQVPVLTATAIFEGSFDAVNLQKLADRYGSLNNKSASFRIGISETRAIRSATLTWNDKELELESTTAVGGLASGVKAMVDDDSLLSGGTFRLHLELRFAQSLSVVPAGGSTALQMSSTWAHPSFFGVILPDSHDIDDNGFTAHWLVDGLARGFPSVTNGNLWTSKQLGFTVYQPISVYRFVDRALNYASLFFIVTLASILGLELVAKVRFHIIQYVVVGVGCLLFYLVLLALSEHLPLGVSYALGAFILALMTTSYAWLATRQRNVTLMIGGLITLLYVSLYLILQLVDYALLYGTLLLVGLLGWLMYATVGLTQRTAADDDDGGEES